MRPPARIFNSVYKQRLAQCSRRSHHKHPSVFPCPSCRRNGRLHRHKWHVIRLPKLLLGRRGRCVACDHDGLAALCQQKISTSKTQRTNTLRLFCAIRGIGIVSIKHEIFMRQLLFAGPLGFPGRQRRNQIPLLVLFFPSLYPHSLLISAFIMARSMAGCQGHG